MAALTAARDAAILYLGQVFPDVHVAPMAASDEAGAILSRLIGDGGIFVLISRAENCSPRESLDFDLRATFAALVVAHGRKNQESREDAGLPVAEKAALALHGATFGLAGASPARVLGLAPISDNDLQKRGLWAWGITWEQTLTL